MREIREISYQLGIYIIYLIKPEEEEKKIKYKYKYMTQYRNIFENSFFFLLRSHTSNNV